MMQKGEKETIPAFLLFPRPLWAPGSFGGGRTEATQALGGGWHCPEYRHGAWWSGNLAALLVSSRGCGARKNTG